ncbi:nucleotidyltransferase domain-containing protein [Hymenobacter properus]|uniref:Nucleotidyltransferase domain-containing protein n=1 Tax=Hymenobacter properus TaxID=2791026 RepID=A0A931BDN3_9BACT|nr:nucleotidyltransferase domain-containing protein [Hymenobacter properus]MBF9140372.1 nucleotidyltransferase domain-containing protein [Hymenobacter properus]MBR7719179.1 nucleotidyltransferase domain-containing protein [Microvirga sp. SRT04]
MVSRIQTALAQLEAAHGIRILYACEAGSRAWGFPSPDSDFDVRLIYCHPPAWYLTLDEGRDTLNFPVDDELDLAGWELRKALRLMRASNAALFEWLQSPVVYHEALHFRAKLAPLWPAAFNRKAGLHHYLGQLRRGVEEDLVGDEVRLKRLFYALRSALAARWIRERPTVPPMELAPLRELLPATLQSDVDDLITRKATANEKTVVSHPAALVKFLQAELGAGQAARETLPLLRPGSVACELNAVFQALISEAFAQ